MEHVIERSKQYKKIGDRLIRTMPEFQHLKDSEVRIAYLASDEAKEKNRKVVYADCRKVSAQYSWCCRYDFMITVYEPNILLFSKDQIETLIRHELHHVGIDFDKAEPTFYVVPHDIEEFEVIINDKGMYWDR